MKLPAPPARKATLIFAGEESAGYYERNSSVVKYPPSLLAKDSELRKGYSPCLNPWENPQSIWRRRIKQGNLRQAGFSKDFDGKEAKFQKTGPSWEY